MLHRIAKSVVREYFNAAHVGRPKENLQIAVVPQQFVDLFHRLVTVHHRHMKIHEHGIDRFLMIAQELVDEYFQARDQQTRLAISTAEIQQPEQLLEN